MVGELAALTTAVLWAISAVIYRQLGARVQPFNLNLYKGVISVGFYIVTLAAVGQLTLDIDRYAVVTLLIGGVIGIGIGDTAFFAALNRIGERRTVLMSDTLSPAFATLLALIALRELLSAQAFVGIVVTVGGVAWVVAERKTVNHVDRRGLRSGVLFGLLASSCQAIGIVISRAVLTQTDVTVLQSASLRLMGGLVIPLAWIAVQGQSYLPATVRSRRLWAVIVGTTLMSTYLGIMLQQLALKHTEAGIVQTLIATAALFVLPLVALRGERIGPRAVAGAIVAVIGIAILFWAKR
ncbi:MAG TPA: DMT family transporter [Pirellulales bacterium]|nr:DMT family transporter [Pirellulales bacterium]